MIPTFVYYVTLRHFHTDFCARNILAREVRRGEYRLNAFEFFEYYSPQKYGVLKDAMRHDMIYIQVNLNELG
jgi:hypothetical protein